MAARRTKQQTAIEAAIEEAGRPLSPGEILDAAQEQAPGLSQATVYRAIRRLEEEGSIHAVEIPGQPPRYETMAAASTHHHHFHCTACDRVFDVEGCSGGIDRLAPPGFEVERHEIVMYGTCDRCRPKAG